MEFLTQLFGNLTSGVIRLAVTVGVLAAVYFFIVKPVLHTTEKTVETTNHAFEQNFGPGSQFDTKALEAKVNKALEDANRQVQIQAHRSFKTAKINGDPQKIVHCIQRANGNVHRIERCSKRY